MTAGAIAVLVALGLGLPPLAWAACVNTPNLALCKQAQKDPNWAVQVNANFDKIDPWTGHLKFGADNTYDIGASGASRPRDLHLGRDLIVGSTWKLFEGATERARLSSGVLTLGHAVTSGAAAADAVTKNTGAFRFLNAAGTSSANFGLQGTATDDLLYGVPGASDDHRWASAGTERMRLTGGGILLLGTTSASGALSGDAKLENNLIVRKHAAFGADAEVNEGTDDSIVRIEELTSTQNSQHSIGLTVSHAWSPASNPNSRLSVGIDVLEIGAPTGGTTIPESMGISVTMLKAGGSASGTMTDVAGISIRPPAISGATVTWTSSYGIDIKDQETVAGIATNRRALRLANANNLWWRNAANSADIAVIGVDASDNTFLNGSASLILTVGGTSYWTALSTGHLVASTDNATDIGVSGAARPRDIWMTRGLSFTAQGVTIASGSTNEVRLYVDESTNRVGGAGADCVLVARKSDGSEVSVATLVTDGGCP